MTSVGLALGGHARGASRLDRPRRRAATRRSSVLWTARCRRAYPVWENEFFNRSVGTVYDLDGAAGPTRCPRVAATAPAERRARERRAARRRRSTCSPTAPVDARAASVVARDPVGVDLYRVDGPIVDPHRTSCGPLHERHLVGADGRATSASSARGGSARGAARERRHALHERPDRRRDARAGRSSAARTIPASRRDDADGAAAAAAGRPLQRRCSPSRARSSRRGSSRARPTTAPLGAHFLKLRPTPPREDRLRRLAALARARRA